MSEPSKRGKLTPEERAERAKARALEAEEGEKRFPHAVLPSEIGGVSFLLTLESGDDRLISVRAKWDGEEWSNQYIDISDIDSLARFVSALCARLNARIEAVNESMRKINLTSALPSELKQLAKERSDAK